MKKQMKTTEQELKELFVLPFGLKKIATLDGLDLFGSDRLNKSFVKTMSKTGRGKAIASTIESMIAKQQFLPAFVSKNIFALIKRKVFPGGLPKGIMGFYSLRHKVIMLCLDNNIKFGFANDDWMARLTIHEGMHKMASEHSSAFMSFFKKDLEDYYAALFTRLFSLKTRPKEMDKIVKFIFFKVEQGQKWHDNSVIMSYYKMLQTTLKKYTTLPDEAFEGMVRDYIVTWKVYVKAPYLLFQNIQKYAHILRPIAYAYKDVYGKFVNRNFYIQEIGIPSEVIAIRSEIKGDSLTYKAFSKLG